MTAIRMTLRLVMTRFILSISTPSCCLFVESVCRHLLDVLNMSRFKRIMKRQQHFGWAEQFAA
ncbi:hypothetical protein [Paenibacillus lactis]|uniref:hypothetical protein n=1 Tax=Paenibacillus lactis TaxID=228574 RepID=UPI00119F4DBC